MPLDNTIEIVTPENIAFHYRVAGPFRRLIAYGLDVTIRALIMGFLYLLMALTSLVTPGFSAAGLGVTLFLVEWFYGGFFETYMNGQTPGKRIMGLRTLTLDGQPINGLQAVLRNILRVVDTMPWVMLTVYNSSVIYPTCMFGLICMMLNNRYQRLGDLVCGTMVVADQRQWFIGMAKLEDPRAIQWAAALPADFRVSRTMSRAIATYVERRQNFSITRRAEIAGHLGAPLVQKLGLAPDTSHDLLLCAIYYRAFIADRANQDETSAAALKSKKRDTVGGGV